MKKKAEGVFAKMKRINERRKKKLLHTGWTTDGLWWYNPRSGLRYTYEGAKSVEDLRSMNIDI